ncbi:MAG: prepilin-type N-terminal cleavage/methylation domain-containing protein, partial [Patescibacteria group bacterium]
MNNKGVSLVELLLVVALIAIIASLSVPFYRSFQIEEQLDTASKDILQVLREAQNKSITAQEDSVWGVHFS